MSDFINPQLHESLIRKLVANSRAIISDQIGISMGGVRMDRILYGLAQFEKLEYPKIQDNDVNTSYDFAWKLVP